MADNRMRVAVQRENEKGRKVGWRNAWLTVDDLAGSISIEAGGALGKKWLATFQANEVQSFEIEQISDTSTLAMMYGGGLLGYGIAALVGRWAKLPVVKLVRPSAEPGESWVEIRGVGLQQRKATREVATRIDELLARSRYAGLRPNLADEELWKFPFVATAVGCGVALLLFACVVFALFYLGSGQ